MATIGRRDAPHGLVTFVYEGNEYLMPLAQMGAGISASYVGAFPPKQVIGDYTRVHHEVLSSLVQSDFTGGGQITDSQESTDTNRYAGIASVDTRYPQMVSLLPQSIEVTGPNTGGAWGLGDIPDIDGKDRFYATFGNALRRVNGTTSTTTVEGSWALNWIPVGSAAVFGNRSQPKMYIPGGAAGYAVFDPRLDLTAAVTHKGNRTPLNFVVHDRKLWCLDVDGVLWSTINPEDDGLWVQVAQVPAGLRPRGVAVFFDRSDAAAPHIVTDEMVYAVDAAVPTIYETELNYAPHPEAGRAWTRWRTDLYVSIGLGIQRYTLGTVNAVGLDHDDGPGAEYSGTVVSMERGFNDLFALIQGTPSPLGSEKFITDQDQDAYVFERVSRSTLMRLTGIGSWHTAWISPGPGGVPTNVMVSGADSRYRMYWGWDGRYFYQDLPMSFENPRQNLTGRFEQSGELVSSWMDMAMVGARMTLAAIEVRARRASETETITVRYQVDEDDTNGTGWRTLGVIQSAGTHYFRVGENGTLPDGETRYDGVGFGRMRYQLSLSRDAGDPEKTPLVESVTVVFIKRMGTLKSFRFRVDCSSPEFDAGWGMGNRERRATLQRMLNSETFIPFAYNDEWHMVKVAGVAGQDGSGMDLRGDRDVTVIESWDSL